MTVNRLYGVKYEVMRALGQVFHELGRSLDG